MKNLLNRVVNKVANKAFTLAEVMITLVIIGIIAAVVIPVALKSKPDENILKFKKGHNTLCQTISTLTASEQYYLNGDLGVKADGTRLNYLGTSDTDLKSDYSKYFCQTFADVLSIKSQNCSSYAYATNYVNLSGSTYSAYTTNLTNAKNYVDTYCNTAMTKFTNAPIITNDDISYFETGSNSTFGDQISSSSTSRLYSSSDSITYADYSGFDRIYKVFCMDIDGINTDEAPFGYGIRADGKILTGNRADEWLEKDLQSDD